MFRPSCWLSSLFVLLRMSRAHPVLVLKVSTPRSLPLQPETQAAQVRCVCTVYTSLSQYLLSKQQNIFQLTSQREEELPCLSSLTRTSRWPRIFVFKSLFCLKCDLPTSFNNPVLRWQKIACRLLRFLRLTLQHLVEFFWRSPWKRGCIPWCLTPCTACRCGLASHWCW